MKNNFDHTFIQFIKALNVPVTKTGASERLLSHPDEGSLLAYSETLSLFKIENAGIKVDTHRLHELPTPFVAYLHQYGGTFSLVKEVTDDHVHQLDTQQGWLKTGKDDFLKKWQGIALLAEATPESGEKNFTEKRKNEILSEWRIPLAITLLTLLIGFFTIPLIAATSTLLFPLLAFFKIGGMITSSLLLIKSIDSKNELVSKLCNNGPKVNCQSVLDSHAAQLTSWLSLSDLGFLYFFGSFFAMLFSLQAGTQDTFLTFQWALSIGSALFSAYSLWYQGVKARMWCTLCLAVVSVFVLELLTLWSFSSFPVSIESTGVIYMITGFLLPVFFLLIFKKSALKAEEANSLKKKLNKIYTNPAYFKSLIENQPFMPEIPRNMPVITFGNKAATHTITLVSNPLCTPCASMHQKLEELIEKTSDINCLVIFLSDENNAGGQFVRKLLSLPKDIQAAGMSEWYRRNDKNFEKWNEKYNSFSEIEEVRDIQKIYNEWINSAEIKATPTLFINGRKKPEDLSVQELGAILIRQKEVLFK